MTKDPSQAVIEVYTQAHCSRCRDVERYLHGQGVAFTLRSVDADASALEEIVARGYMSTPVIRIGDHWIAGFKRRALEQALKTISR